MIQRIQTLYLIIALILLSISFATPLAKYNLIDQSYELNAFGFEETSENTVLENPEIPIYIWTGILIVMLVIAILMFKKRKLQIKINWLISLLLIGLIVYIFFYSDKIVFPGVPDLKPAYQIGLYLIVAALPCVILANRSIKKDENLVKSLDRIR